MVNLLLLLAMLGMMISGMMISSNVFSFLNIPTTMFGRRLHMVSTSWGFVLMGVHIGLHLNSMMSKLNKKMKNNTFEYVYYFILALIMAFGAYSVYKLKLWEDMFLLNDFKFFDYNQSPVIFYLEYVGMLVLVALIIYFIFAIKRKFKEKGEKVK